MSSTVLIGIITCIGIVLSSLLIPQIRIGTVSGMKSSVLVKHSGKHRFAFSERKKTHTEKVIERKARKPFLDGFTVDSYWIVALFGAVTMVATGSIPISEITESLTADTAVNPLKILVLFISMTVMSVYLDVLGFFRKLADTALCAAGTSQRRLMLYLFATVSLLTVFTSNDIIILTFTPFICCFCKNAGVSPIPYLFSEFIAANTWSMALIIGNPTNIYLSSAGGMEFVEYAKAMAAPTICAGIVSFVILVVIFGKKLKEPFSPEARQTIVTDKVLITIGLVHLSVCTVLLALSAYIGTEMWIIALSGAISLFACTSAVYIKRKKAGKELTECVKRAPWQIIPFLISMFIIILAINKSGITAGMSELLRGQNVVYSYGLSSFFAANVINNIPMSVLFASVLKPLSDAEYTRAALATVIGSNLGAYLTPIGALAGIMWSSILKTQGVRFKFTDFIKYGAAVSVPTILTALFVLDISGI